MPDPTSTTPAPAAAPNPELAYPQTPAGKQALFDEAMGNPQYAAYWEKLHPSAKEVLDKHRAA